MSLPDLTVKFFLQLAVILLLCRILTFFGRRYLKQATVVCEMIAGVVIGPSFFGLIFPQFQSFLFPKNTLLLVDGQTITNPSMTILYAISQVGLIFYMFVVGMDFNLNHFKKRIRPASIVSFIGIFFPFTLGVLMAGLFNHLDFFQPQISFGFRAIFMGIALSITAFPVLARILEENKITTTSFGTLVLAAGSMDDLMAWLMLAILLSLLKKSIIILLIAIVGTLLFIIFLLLLKKPLEWLLYQRFDKREKISTQAFNTAIILLLLATCFTDKIGIYSVFGAFLAGAALPRSSLTNKLKKKINNFVVPILLPIFFVYSGLNTQISLLFTPDMMIATIIILLASIVGKGFGCMVAARLANEHWSNAIRIGILMNARGLMELVLLNIGLQASIITPTLYTILVLMAIVTTAMTPPLFYFFQEKFQNHELQESMIE